VDLVVEINVLLENDDAVVVSNDVIAVQAVAILVKVVRTFGTRVALHVQDRLADLLGIETLSVIDGERQHMNRVIRP
jgi:hypothetical protein